MTPVVHNASETHYELHLGVGFFRIQFMSRVEIPLKVKAMSSIGGICGYVTHDGRLLLSFEDADEK